MTPADMVQKYIAFRDRMKRLAEARAEEDRPYNEAMELIEGLMLQHLNDTGAESLKTEFGTVYKSTTMSARVADPTALFDYVREADAFHLLTAAVAKDAVKQHMAEHQDAPPPGVDISFFTRVNFRRA